MKILNNKQEDFLLAISREKKECIRTIGRRIYSTDVSCYHTRNLLLSFNLITLNKNKNKEIPSLTIKGRKMVEKIFDKRHNFKKAI